MSTDLAVIEAALKAATPGPWSVKEINLGAIGTQDDVLWPWVFATNPMPIPAAHGATTGPLIADLSRRHEEDPEDGIDYTHGGIASIETTDGNYPERDAADANLIANAPTWLAELVERVKAAEAEVERLADWKASALPVMDGLQELGKSLGLPLGALITGPLAFAASAALNDRAETAEATIDRVRELAESVPKTVAFNPSDAAYLSGQVDFAEAVLDALNHTGGISSESATRGLRHFRLAAVRWRDQLPDETTLRARAEDATEPILRPTDQRYEPPTDRSGL